MKVTINDLSIGDKILWCGVETTVTQTLYDVLSKSPILMQYVSRIPCSVSNTKKGDYYYDNTFCSIFQWAGCRVLTSMSKPLQKELSAHLAKVVKPKEGSAEWAWEQMEKGKYVNFKDDGKPYYVKNGTVYFGFRKDDCSELQSKEIWIRHWSDRNDWYICEPKPLLADAEVGDLVRFSNGQVEEIINTDADDVYVKLGIISEYCISLFNKITGKDRVESGKIYATELIKCHSLQWAVEMLKKGKAVKHKSMLVDDGRYVMMHDIIFFMFSTVLCPEMRSPHGSIETFFREQDDYGTFRQSGWTLYEENPIRVLVDEPLVYGTLKYWKDRVAKRKASTPDCHDCKFQSRKWRYEKAYKKGYEACRADMINKIKGE